VVSPAKGEQDLLVAMDAERLSIARSWTGFEEAEAWPLPTLELGQSFGH
jgi:hypothetical protein